MSAPPPVEAEYAILGPDSNLVRRVEIYEADAVTRWEAGAYDDRLTGGSVSIDYSRDERRSLDLTLDNTDFALEHTPEKFWYDKIIKVFCGVEYIDTTPVISTQVRTNLSTNPRGVSSVGFSPNNVYWTTTYNQSAAGHPLGVVTAAKVTVNDATNAGTTVVTLYNTDTLGNYGTARYFGAWVWSPVATTATVYCGGNQAGTTKSASVPANTWVFLQTAAKGTGYAILTMVKGSSVVLGDYALVTGVVSETTTTPGSFFDGAMPDFGNRDYAWTGAVGTSTSTETITLSTESAVTATWETQIGEFMIDSISEDHFPYVVKVAGRDYTKKCLLAKFGQATAFGAGSTIESVIKTIAQGAGITKFLLPLTGSALGKDYFFERGVSRWEAIKQISDAFGYELFFDAQGYLVMREYLDPITAPLAYTLETGEFGNLSSYNKTVNDTRIYNHIVVTGESADSDTIPVSAESFNTEPSSPTRIDKLGDRTYQYTSSFITTTAQAQDVADKFLKIHSLEEFDLNFNAIALPWLEVGEIVEFVDPRPSAGQPTRFLLSSLTLSLGLEPMGGNAKRVSVVG